jgi:hypothetical protein
LRAFGVRRAICAAASARIVHEGTGKRRNRLLAYSKHLALLDKGAEPLPPV